MTASATGPLPLRVTVGDTWLPLLLEAAPNETVAQDRAILRELR
ncbi:MAG: hypothetical protein ACHQX4_08075 [Gemmatimonadales bacterium]